MKKSEKKMILILIIVGLLIVGGIWLIVRSKNNTGNNNKNSQTSASQEEFTKVEEDGTIVNTSEKLKEDREEIGFGISDIKFEEKGGQTILTARVTNKTEADQSAFLANLVLLDKSGKEIGKIPLMISDMQKGETIEIEASITESYANAYDFKLEK